MAATTNPRLKESPFQRARRLGALYRAGATLQAIADQEGISRQRVHKILCDKMAISAEIGGHHATGGAEVRQRNAHIVSLRQGGEPVRSIAARYGISVRRVYAVLSRNPRN